MTVFRVWDELNSEESFAREIDAFDAADAAEGYAAEDVDGNCDGIYMCSDRDGRREIMVDVSKNGHPISVRDPDGKLHRFRVGIIELVPRFLSEEVDQ